MSNQAYRNFQQSSNYWCKAPCNDEGPTGPTGPMGEMGATGPQGDIGPTGTASFPAGVPFTLHFESGIGQNVLIVNFEYTKIDDIVFLSWDESLITCDNTTAAGVGWSKGTFLDLLPAAIAPALGDRRFSIVGKQIDAANNAIDKEGGFELVLSSTNYAIRPEGDTRGIYDGNLVNTNEMGVYSSCVVYRI